MDEPQTPKPADRDERGRFGPNNRVNPGGQTKAQAEARKLLQEALDNPEMLSRALRAYAKAIEDGEVGIILDYFNRQLGKPKDVVQHEGSAASPFSQLTVDELRALAQAEIRAQRDGPR